MIYAFPVSKCFRANSFGINEIDLRIRNFFHSGNAWNSKEIKPVTGQGSQPVLNKNCTTSSNVRFRSSRRRTRSIQSRGEKREKLASVYLHVYTLLALIIIRFPYVRIDTHVCVRNCDEFAQPSTTKAVSDGNLPRIYVNAPFRKFLVVSVGLSKYLSTRTFTRFKKNHPPARVGSMRIDTKTYMP